MHNNPIHIASTIGLVYEDVLQKDVIATLFVANGSRNTN